MSSIDATAPAAAAWTIGAAPDHRLRVGIVGCGDVAHRRYLPALAGLADQVEIVGCCDVNPLAAARAAGSVRAWSPAVASTGDLDALLTDVRPDAIFNLTPAPRHAPVTRAALEADAHVFSEKPIADSIAEADALIALATTRRLLLLCAPASAISRRVRWLREIAVSERLGRLTLAVAHHADPGPAAWREYTGDPTVFYQPPVGPLVDHGIYRLHELTSLMGSVTRVQAMGSIGNPARVVRGGPRSGSTIAVTTPDHVLLNLEFVGGALGQVLASFGTPSTRTPWLELHFTQGTISFPPGSQYDPNGRAGIYLDDDGPLGLEGWVDEIGPPPPRQELDLVESGAAHFVAVLRGEEPPVLSAEHARHVLDIMLRAYESIDDGRSHELTTTMDAGEA
jgi:predicted dehydrogenase